MKKIISLIFILQGLLIQAVIVQLPSYEKLRERVKGIQYFNILVGQTAFLDDFARKRGEAVEITYEIKSAVDQWCKRFYKKDDLMSFMMQREVPRLIEVMFQDAPAALEELRNIGIIKK